MAHLDPDVINAYIDAELPPEEMAAVESHLAACDSCRIELEELHGVATLVRQLPAYRPRRDVDIPDGAGDAPGAMATIVEFSKPLALAAIILLVAFAGLRLLSDMGNGDNGGDEQIPFSAVQPELADGTESAGETSRTVTAEESAPAAAGSLSESDSEASETTMQQAAPAISATQPVATAPPVETPAPTGDDDGPSFALIVATSAAVLAIAGSAAWYTLRRSPRRRRS